MRRNLKSLGLIVPALLASACGPTDVLRDEEPSLLSSKGPWSSIASERARAVRGWLQAIGEDELLRVPTLLGTQRTAAFLHLLAPCEPFLAHWYKPARSRKDLHKHPLMPPDLPTLTEAFRRGVNREDGGPAIEELGFGFGFDNV